MRRTVEKSLCKCARCVAKRRIRFFTLSGLCIATAIGCYVFVGHSRHAAPLSVNLPEVSAKESVSEASAILRGSSASESQVLPQPTISWKRQDTESAQENLAQDGFSTGSLGLSKGLMLPEGDRYRLSLPSSSPMGEAPTPHTSGWQTVPLADALKSGSEAGVQGTSRPDVGNAAAIPAESSPGPTFGGEVTVHPAAETSQRKDGEVVGMANRSDRYELLPRWLRELLRKSDGTTSSGNQLVWQNHGNAEDGPESIPAASAITLAAHPESALPKSETPEAATNRGPVMAQIERPEAASGEIDGADTRVAAKAAVSPTLANVETDGAGSPNTWREWTPENAVVKTPELAEPLPPQPNEEDLASRSKINNGKHDPADEQGEPRGYITIESKPEASLNPGTATHPPTPPGHAPRVQDPLLVQDRPLPMQDHPSFKGADHLSKPGEESRDLRRFASAFLQTDRTGNIADQHRFYADSVHFYREGDLSWAGVEAATRRYHQERQVKRYGNEGIAAVKGPIDGGFYVVEQPVYWSRTEGSRLIHGRSVLRLRVVPSNRGDWKITSIEEIGQ